MPFPFIFQSHYSNYTVSFQFLFSLEHNHKFRVISRTPDFYLVYTENFVVFHFCCACLRFVPRYATSILQVNLVSGAQWESGIFYTIVSFFFSRCHKYAVAMCNKCIISCVRLREKSVITETYFTYNNHQNNLIEDIDIIRVAFYIWLVCHAFEEHVSCIYGFRRQKVSKLLQNFRH